MFFSEKTVAFATCPAPTLSKQIGHFVRPRQNTGIKIR